MNKAILILDMPDSCSKCPCLKVGWLDYYCGATNNTIVFGYENKEREANCPIKHIPEKKLIWNDNDCDYELGYNNCLDDINGCKHEEDM